MPNRSTTLAAEHGEPYQVGVVVAKKTSATPATADQRPGRVRIIGGRLKGSRLEVPLWPGLRPTPDRLRETLFNWLQPSIIGARCLDLFAGSGALGLEAGSRGAASVVLVEREPVLATSLRANGVRLQVAVEVVCAEASAWLRSVPRPFDLVFLDPPFADQRWPAISLQLEQGGWLADPAWIYVETPDRQDFDPPSGWRPYRETRVGAVRGRLYRRSVAVQ
jgi:16S rRNA (guanine966-N2)-methyltransferase